MTDNDVTVEKGPGRERGDRIGRPQRRDAGRAAPMQFLAECSSYRRGAAS